MENNLDSIETNLDVDLTIIRLHVKLEDCDDQTDYQRFDPAHEPDSLD